MLRQTLLSYSAVVLGCSSVLADTSGGSIPSTLPHIVVERKMNKVGADGFPMMTHRTLAWPAVPGVLCATRTRGGAHAELVAGKNQALFVSGGRAGGSSPAKPEATSLASEPDEPGGVLSVFTLPPYLLALGILGVAALGSEGLSRLYVSKLLASPWILPVKAWQLLPPLAYFLNLKAVGLPGRLDERENRESPMAKLVRFFSPASWAFAIWAPIFLGETAYVLYQLLPLASVRELWWLEEMSTWFAGAMLFQILWCLSFRPWAKDAGMLWLPTLMLGGAGVALRGVYEILNDAWVERDIGILGLIVVYVPLSLHFGWISCATLVNANGYVATFPRAPNVLKLVASTLSVVAAVALSITVTAAYESPIYGTVVAWALWAIGSRAGWRNLEGRVDPRLIGVQELVAKAGSVLSLMVAYTPVLSTLLESLSKIISEEA